MKPSFRVVLPLVGLMACMGDDPVGGAGADAGAPVDATAPQKDGDAPDTSPPSDAGPGETGPGDSGPTGRCDPTKEFGTPVLMAGLNSSVDEASFTMTSDELTAWMHRENSGGADLTILQATRANLGSSFGAPSTRGLEAINSGIGSDYAPSSSPDGLALYFERSTAASLSTMVATRVATNEAFGDPLPVLSNGEAMRNGLRPYLETGGRFLYYQEVGTLILKRIARGATPSMFGPSQSESTEQVFHSVVSSDGLVLYYTDSASNDILRATRPNTTGPFGAGSPVVSLNSGNREAPLYLTHDNCVLVLKSDRPGGLGGFDLYMATRPK